MNCQVGFDLEPAHGEVRAHRELVVVVLEELAHREEVEDERVARDVVALEVAVAVAVPAPVHDRAVDRAHDEVRGKQEPHPPVGRERRSRTRCTPRATTMRAGQIWLRRSSSGQSGMPFVEARLRLLAAVREGVVALLRRPHHREDVAVVRRRVRILRRVAVRVMHAMQDRVAARAQEARALRDVRAEVEEALPALRHRELLVRAVAVQEEGLEEDRRQPVPDEEDQDHHRGRTLERRRPVAAIVWSGMRWFDGHEMVTTGLADRSAREHADRAEDRRGDRLGAEDEGAERRRQEPAARSRPRSRPR